MDKVWLTQYPRGVPAEVDVADASVTSLLRDACRRFGSRTAFCNLGGRLSYADVDRISRKFAAYLRGELGLAPGERVAVMLPNSLQYPVVMFGIIRAGLVVVNVNPQYTERELAHQLRDSGAAAVVVLENFAHTLELALPSTAVRKVIVSRLGDLLPRPRAWVVNAALRYVKHQVPAWQIRDAVALPQALTVGARQVFADHAAAPEDMAFLQYTGGTTGVAKGAILSHGNIVANVRQITAWLAPRLREGEEIALIPLPLYHIYALTSCLFFVSIGATIALVTDPRDRPALVRQLARVNPSVMIGVNTLYAALLHHQAFENVALTRLKLASAGGMAVQRAVADAWQARVGIPLLEGYGLSETSPLVMANPVDIVEWTGAVGVPLPSTEVVILGEEDLPVANGQRGEICVRGPQVTRGYWNNPSETSKAFTRDGWFRTGDIGTMDEHGTFRVTDRKKDMIIVSGFNVYPNEIEDVVMLHPGVLEVGAVGTPDERSGERVKVFVVRKDPLLSEEALLSHCARHLVGYKQPVAIEFREEPLPKTPIGKVLRRELRVATRTSALTVQTTTTTREPGEHARA